MDPSQLLEAHVRFELDRWQPEALTGSVAVEVDAAFGWLSTVPVSDLLSVDRVVQVTRRTALALTENSEFRDAVTAAALGAVEGGLPDGTTVADLIDRRQYDNLVGVLVAMEGLREEVILQVTTSEAYSNLLAHILYHGLKSYLLTENVLARKLPGASTLVRLGQSAMNTAVPRLEPRIDRQLTSYVNANISDSIKESRRYLDSALDDARIRDIADEVWRTNARRTVADVRSLVPPGQVDAVADIVADLVRHWLEDGRGERVLAAATTAWFDANGDRSAADVLAGVGVTAATVTPDLIDLVGPVVEAARRSGYLEQRIRARLEPFYASL